MKIPYFFTGLLAITLLSNCNSSSSKISDPADSIPQVEEATSINTEDQASPKDRKAADAKTILSRKQVPVLCYHQIRDWRSTDSKSAKDYIIPVATFKSHIKMLKDSGYNSVLPDQVYNYLVYGDALPEKPVMITFDDTDLTQLEVGNKVLKEHGFKGAYFMMTVVIGKHGRVNYMNKDEIKQVATDGNTVGLHTYDHPNLKKVVGDEEWDKQIKKSKALLEEISGQKVEHLAYPFGLWNKEAIVELKKRGIKSAYILATSRDENDPLYTIRRIIASGYWSAKTLHNSMVGSFSEKRN